MKKMRKFLTRLTVMVLLMVFVLSAAIVNAVDLERVSFTDATVNVSSLNMRQEANTNAPVIAVLKKSQDLKVLGKLGDWYAVYDPSTGKIGAVSGKYITPVTAESKNDPKLPDEQAPSVKDPTTPVTGITADQERVLTLVNNVRKQNGKGELEFDKNLTKVAMEKAKDMVTKNYFSHNSPTYGTPFEMMKKYGITFKAAGENIAGNQTMDGAFNAWMASSGHKANILNGDYNATGIGVYNSPVYGKIIVQMFIKK